MVRVNSYKRTDRGKIISVPSHNRKNRPRGRKKVAKIYSYTSDHIPRINPPGVIKLKKPITIKRKITRYKESGMFTDEKNE